MTTTIDEINAQIEDLEEKVQLLRNEKVKKKLFEHVNVKQEELECITNFRLQSSYTSWESEYNEFASGRKGSIELTFTRNNKEVGFSMTFIKESPSWEDGYENRYGWTEKMHTHYVNESEDPLIKKILARTDSDELESWLYILRH